MFKILEFQFGWQQCCAANILNLSQQPIFDSSWNFWNIWKFWNIKTCLSMAAGRGKELLSLFQRAGCLQSGENLSGEYTQYEISILDQNQTTK